MNKVIIIIIIIIISFAIVFSCCKTKEKARQVQNDMGSNFRSEYLFIEFGEDSVCNLNIKELILGNTESVILSTKKDYINIIKQENGNYKLSKNKKFLPELFKIFANWVEEENDSELFVIPCYTFLTPKRLDSVPKIPINHKEIESLVSSKLFFDGFGTTFKLNIYQVNGKDNTNLSLIESRSHSNLLIEEFEYLNKPFVDFKNYLKGTYLIKLESSYGIHYEYFIEVV